jgi:hypothetical protein
MNTRMSMAVHMALEQVRRGVPVRQAAATAGVWPSSVYIAIKREGVKVPAKRKTARAAG